MNVLVTGGAGFIGSHIVDALHTAGYDVGVLDDFSTGKDSNLLSDRDKIRIHDGSIADEKFVKKALHGYDAVFHEAARVSVTRSIEDPLTTNMVNTDGTLNLLTAAVDSGVEKFVFASSSSVYGNTPSLPKVETMPPNPISPYAVSKLAGENYCRVFASVYGLKTVCLRYFNVYGPRQRPGAYSGVISIFADKALSGDAPVIFGDGSQTRDFTYVKDVVQANILSLEREVEGGEVFNIGSHQQTSLDRLAGLVTGLAGRSDLRPSFKPQRPGDVMHSLADITKASRSLGYAPRYGIDSGLAETMEWFKSERAKHD